MCGLFCGAVWTPSRAAEAGYDLPDISCVLCGAPVDDLIYRLYRCKHQSAVDARATLGKTFLEKFPTYEQFHRSDIALLWLRGIVAHPTVGAPMAANENIATLKVN